MIRSIRLLLAWQFVFAALLNARTSCTAEGLPAEQLQFLETHCWDCHLGEDAEGEMDLEMSDFAWNAASRQRWERVLRVIESGEMPPQDSSDLEDSERSEMAKWIHESLMQNTAIGGTQARRLSRSEYKETVEALFGIKDYELPPGFPLDRSFHGFNNLGEGLVVSPALLESYGQSAAQLADMLFPPQRRTAESMTFKAGPGDLVISYSSGLRTDDALRLGMKCDPIQRSCTWPSRIETRSSGTYRISVELSAFRPAADAAPMLVKILARDIASSDSVRHGSLRELQQIEVSRESPERFEFEAVLYEGQTPVIHWANARLDSDKNDKTQLQEFFASQNEINPRYLAAWHAMISRESGQGFRGGSGWQRVKAQLAREDLPEISDKERESLLKKIASNPVLYAETVVFDVLENGPALAIHELQIEGPFEQVDGPREKEQQRLRANFFAGDAAPERAIRRFLDKAFRRPVDDATAQTWLGIYKRHLDEGHTQDEAIHLVIRNALISPRFLYRCINDGPLDGPDLATRLAYFLTGAPPDEKLTAAANSGVLLDAEELESQARRLMPKRPDSRMIQSFTSQWLDTRRLSDIMPDQKFKFSDTDQKVARQEVEYFFAEMLRENRPLEQFIDPDFTWTSARLAKNIYELKGGYDKKKTNSIHRVTLPQGGRHGGVLGQAAIMMATANGVDTQPVLRGVWVLENILGTPPPPPPKAVPPITPDTAGAKTPRELLAQHTSQTSCAACHRKIDPVGLVLENFDPVGRWRTEWPGTGTRIDASGVLPDGTNIASVQDFKAWLILNIDQFSQCFAEKLMTYATGRVLNYAEREEMRAIVRANHQQGNRCRDLVLMLLQSETFRTK